MNRSTLSFCIFFLCSSFLPAQVQNVLPVSSARSGAVTSVVNNWEAIGVNPANLGWDNNDKLSFSFINPGLSGQSGGLNMDQVHILMRQGDTNQPWATRRILGAPHGASLFADANWLAFSFKVKKAGTFAVSLCDKALLNLNMSPDGATLLTEKGHISDSEALHKLIGTTLSLSEYRELNVAFGRELFEAGGQNASNNDYYVNYNVRYAHYLGNGVMTDTASQSDSGAFKVYGGIGIKYIWGQTYFNGNVDNQGINADYAVPPDFPNYSLLPASNPGHGFAADLGVSATYKKWVFGLSATDLGSITWRQSSFTIADTTIYGLNSIDKVINEIDSNTIADFKNTRNVTMNLASKVRLGAAYILSKHLTLSGDIILPLNNSIGNLPAPYFAFGTQTHIWKILVLDAGISTVKNYGVSVPVGVSLCAGHTVQMYFGTADVLTYLGKANNGNISAAYGLLRINIRGKKNDTAKH